MYTPEETGHRYVLFTGIKLDIGECDFKGSYDALLNEFGYDEELEALGITTDEEVESLFHHFRKYRE